MDSNRVSSTRTLRPLRGGRRARQSSSLWEAGGQSPAWEMFRDRGSTQNERMFLGGHSKYHGLGDLSNRHFFLTVLEARHVSSLIEVSVELDHSLDCEGGICSRFLSLA